MLKTSALLAAILAAVVAPAGAQTCRGAASLDRAPLQLGASMGFGNSERTVGASFLGGHDSTFGFAHVGYDTFTQVNVGTPDFGGGIGSTFPMTGRARLCSLGDVTYFSGPSVGGIDTHTLLTTAGGQVGIVAFDTPALQIVPTVGAALRLVRTSATAPNGASVVVADHYGMALIGVGIIVNGQLAVTPTIAVPFALVGGETSVGIALTYNFK